MNQFARPGLAVTQLPSFNENDKGKVLTINSESGALGWEEGSGGSSLPTDPAQDGTYNLQNTVSSGTSTLSWASGSSGGGWALKVGYESDGANTTADKTAGEILSALNDGPVLFYSKDDPDYQVLSPCAYAESNGTDYFEFHVENVGSMMASSSTDYPVASNGD